MFADLPPAILVLAGALLVPLLPTMLRKVWLLALPAAALVQVLTWPEGQGYSMLLFGQPLELMRIDALSSPFSILFPIGAFVGMTYALRVDDRLEQTAAIFYVGSALGATMAGDLVTLFVFWELLAVSSVFLIWARRTPNSTGAGLRYLAAQITSGLLLFSGILLHLEDGGSLTFGSFVTADMGLQAGIFDVRTPSGLLILLAFGLKCGFPGLHNWLVDGYASSTPTGTVFLSGFTTKVAIYAMLRGFAGEEVLIPIGLVMTCFPIYYAVIENDLRRVLGYSMINQLGFMVVGIGIGTELAVNGTIAHAFNDVFFKGLLFMTMGAVLLRTGTCAASDLGGLYKSMPWTTGFCLVGAASISALPLFSAFASKSMIMVAAANEGYEVTWFVLLFAAAGVLHHAGIKIPFFAFFAHDSGKRPAEAPLTMRLGMLLAAAVCIFNGCYPQLLYSLLPYATGYWPYDTFHVISQTQLVLFTALAAFTMMLIRMYPPELRSVNLEFDWVLRKGGRLAMAVVRGPLSFLGRGVERLVLETLPSRFAQVTWRRRVSRGGREGGPRLTFVEASMLLVIAMLVSFLLFNYLIPRGGR